MTECIALFRGINVGRAKRIAMRDLRKLFEGLGAEDVRTVLNSGNVLFRCARPNESKLRLSLQRALEDTCGFSAQVTVITAAKLASIVRENPLLDVTEDPSRHFTAFVANPKSLIPLRALLAESWAPDVLAIGTQAATGDTVTTRNWATVLKLLAASNAAA